MPERHTGDARWSLPVPAAVVLVVALTLGIAPRSWALPAGTCTGTATGCVFVDPETVGSPRSARLDAEVVVTLVPTISGRLPAENRDRTAAS